MYSLSLQNAPEGLRPGILTKHYSDDDDNDPDQDAKFDDAMRNAEKQIQDINRHLNQAKHIGTDIDKYKNALRQIRNDVDVFLKEDQELFVLIDQMIEDKSK